MSATNTSTSGAAGTFTEDERAAMRQRAKELAAEAKASKNKAAGEKMTLEAIGKLSEPDRSMAQKIHEIVTKNAPTLWPKTWYGMPAYATAEGKVICFYQPAEKFKARYGTLGFNDGAMLDDGEMWATSFAIKKLTSAEAEKITKLVQKAVG